MSIYSSNLYRTIQPYFHRQKKTSCTVEKNTEEKRGGMLDIFINYSYKCGISSFIAFKQNFIRIFAMYNHTDKTHIPCLD